MKRALAVCGAVLWAASALAQDVRDPGIARALRSLSDVYRLANVIEVQRAAQVKLPPEIPIDPWGKPYRVDFTETGYRIAAAGADGRFDESTWIDAHQFSGVDGDVVFENGKSVRSNRNWLVERAKDLTELGALEGLRQAEMMFMMMRAPVMTEVTRIRITAKALQELGELVDAHARTNGGSIARFPPPSVHDAWGTTLQFSTEGETYRIVSAGADRQFDAMSWSRPATGSAAEDIVFENGRFKRAPDEREVLKSGDLTVRPVPQPVDAPLPATLATRFPRFGNDVQAPVVLTRVEPEYPESYRRARISGIVIVEAAITATGAIETLRLLKSVAPELDASAMKAVRQWTFQPAQKDGQPIAVLFNLSVNFKLK